MYDLDLRELRIFQAVVDENGFQRAANRVHISQSAVSQALARLEEKLGAQLIIRSTPLELTEAGQRVLAFARSALNDELALFSDLSRIQEGAGTTLSVAMNNYIRDHFSVPLLDAFFRELPQADLRVEVQPSREIIYAVASNRWELGFGPFQKEMSAFRTVGLFTETRRLVIGNRLARRQESGQSMKEFLETIPLITSFLDPVGERPQGGKIRDRFRTVWEINNNDLRLDLVKAGRGAMFVETGNLEDDRNYRGLVPVEDVPYASIRRKVGLYHKKDEPLSTAAQTFIRICREYWS
jgi:DNA-binding transcriptional LysR family regulator